MPGIKPGIFYVVIRSRALETVSGFVDHDFYRVFRLTDGMLRCADIFLQGTFRFNLWIADHLADALLDLAFGFIGKAGDFVFRAAHGAYPSIGSGLTHGGITAGRAAGSMVRGGNQALPRGLILQGGDSIAANPHRPTFMESPMKQHISKADVTTSFDAAKHAIADGFDNGLTAMRDETNELKAMASQSAAHAADTISQGIRNAGEEADILLNAAGKQATALQKMMVEELRVHPLRSLGIAAAIGLLAGYVSRR